MMLHALLCLVVITSPTTSSRVPTMYDVLELIYQVCSTEDYHRQESLDCVSSRLGTKVTNAMQRCLANDTAVSNVKELCEHLTLIPRWKAKHNQPPTQLTRVVGLAALGRMACVLGLVQQPVPKWQAAFEECYPGFHNGARRHKESSRGSGENILPIPE